MKLFIALLFLAVSAMAQSLPKPEREFRAVWIATVDNIDFPTRRGLPPEQQKQELLSSIELAKKLRLNAVIFQVRPMTDAVYRSSLEPWSEFLTGEMGKPQDFDPLEFLIKEAHKRGMLVHAWFNPYRSFHPSAKTISANHISKTRPSIVRQYGRYMWLDPTSPEAQRYSVDVIADVVRRYDIDGVHFDDYFYPYAEKDAAGNDIEFPDHENWSAYQASGGKLGRDDWRRMHVNKFIEAVGRRVKQIKPDVVYGISPFGIWQPMPEKGINGFNAYAKLYADARKWLQDGTVDYLAPQLYWETARQGLSFPVLLDWWKEQNTRRRFIWPGVAAYRIGSTATFTAGEIGSQIDSTRRDPLTKGAIYFSFKSLRNDMGGIQNVLRDKTYARDAVVPHFSWIKSTRPRMPKVRVSRDGRFVRASWTERGKVKAFWFVVYARDKDGWSYSVLPASEGSIALSAERRISQVVVTSVDRLGNESRKR
jgi:uncharacterized lipoprotein YddW (UPF0748 family)